MTPQAMEALFKKGYWYFCNDCGTPIARMGSIACDDDDSTGPCPGYTQACPFCESTDFLDLQKELERLPDETT